MGRRWLRLDERHRIARHALPRLLLFRRAHTAAARRADPRTVAAMSGAHSALHRLAERAGILPEYYDQTGNLCRTSDDTRRALLAALRIDASSEEAARDALALLDDAQRRELIAPVQVI